MVIQYYDINDNSNNEKKKNQIERNEKSTNQNIELVVGGLLLADFAQKCLLFTYVRYFNQKSTVGN